MKYRNPPWRNQFPGQCCYCKKPVASREGTTSRKPRGTNGAFLVMHLECRKQATLSRITRLNPHAARAAAKETP